MSENTEKRGRGRPKMYTGLLLAYIVGLLGTIGLDKTHKLLTRSGAVLTSFEKKHGIKRDSAMVPKRLKITKATLCHIGQEAGIEQVRGRPKKVAA